MDKIELQHDGRILSGFDEAEIQISLDEIAGTFSLKLPERFRSQSRGLSLPDVDSEVSLLIGSKPIMKGFVEVIDSESTEAGGYFSFLHGREITSDIVDSSITYSKTLSGPIDRIIREIVAPFKLKVVSNSSQNVTMTTEKGESVWETIEVLSRKTGNIIWTRGDGVLNVGTGSRAKYSRKLNSLNIKQARSKFSSHGTFSDYSVMSMTQSTENSWGGDTKKTVSVKGSSGRYRPLIVKGETSLTPAEALARARWEASIREARSITATATIAGFRIGDELAEINRLVEVEYEILGLKKTMLISSVRFTYSKAFGGSTLLELSQPNAFEPKPIDAKASRGDAKKIRGWS
jgi:prophage tail gpP-like protein